MECECLHCSSRGPDSVCIDKDFLRYFTDIDRVLLFDDSWTVASCWLEVPITPIPSPPAYGLLSCKLTSSFSGLTPAENSSRLVKVTVPKKTKAVFALSRLNERSFKSLGDSIAVNFEFAVVKRGELHPIATASPCRPFTREASLELSLDQGEYLVYVKLEQRRMLDPSTDYADWDNVPYRSYPNITNVSLVSRSVACKRRWYGFQPNSRVVSKILTAKVKALSITQSKHPPFRIYRPFFDLSLQIGTVCKSFRI